MRVEWFVAMTCPSSVRVCDGENRRGARNTSAVRFSVDESSFVRPQNSQLPHAPKDSKLFRPSSSERASLRMRWYELETTAAPAHPVASHPVATARRCRNARYPGAMPMGGDRLQFR